MPITLRTQGGGGKVVRKFKVSHPWSEFEAFPGHETFPYNSLNCQDVRGKYSHYLRSAGNFLPELLEQLVDCK